MDYLPIFCRLDNKPVLLVGGGEVAERKARLLLDAGARLTVVSPVLDPELAALAASGTIDWLAAEFELAHLTSKWLVVAATDRREVNALVYQSANQAGIFANVVDDPKRSSFIMPSIIDRSPLMVAISSGGKAPVLARLLREKLEALLPQHLGAIAAFAGGLRDRVKARFASMGERRQFWERLLGADRLGQALARGDKASANQLADALFAEDAGAKGEVILVGAGPGDPGLLTLHALRHMQQADLVVYDRLVSDEVMALVRRDARRIFVGKQAGNHCVPQEGINQLLLEEASKGQRVVRLKGETPSSSAGAARSWRRWSAAAWASRWCRGSRRRAAARPMRAFLSPIAITPRACASSQPTARVAPRIWTGLCWLGINRLWCFTWDSHRAPPYARS